MLTAGPVMALLLWCAMLLPVVLVVFALDLGGTALGMGLFVASALPPSWLLATLRHAGAAPWRRRLDAAAWACLLWSTLALLVVSGANLL